MTWPPRDVYGRRDTDDALLLEVGPRVAHSYDEIFAIEHRLGRATRTEIYVPGRQTRWYDAALAESHRRATEPSTDATWEPTDGITEE